ncbi:HAD family hydrolase [Pelagovum pacificum]|uniref:HAD-IA family hydrolase n=1 Tax=Pelagovum pacificum TaxID=2588711 RepID=A0A5C5G795_9RHOB|nr:HAD family hydrolase [Pelagovum pacificum]QQA45090.1 hypothetical protein I8N54_19925 [Pelagovum pacificum]TNY30536.1 hypothetical protein FHY64_19620 [Pelagovum pacificum]
MKVLLLSNLGSDMGMPLFRLGSYKTNLLPLASSLLRDGDTEIRILASDYVARELKGSARPHGVEPNTILGFRVPELNETGWDSFMTRSYRETLPDEVITLVEAELQARLKGWQPDVIISWEAPTGLFRRLWPDALVLDIMPGAFMRPPYPPLISFDPVGLYGDCWYANEDPTTTRVSDQALAEFGDLRALYLKHFSDLDVRNCLDTSCGLSFAGNICLMPMQITDYFGWKDNTTFQTQFQLLETVLATAPAETDVLPTQYVGSLVSERIIDNSNIDRLRQVWPNLRYDFGLEALDNISQYLISASETVISVSSTLGLQAKILGKRLISPSGSHLAPLADSVSFKDGHAAPVRDLSPFLTAMLTRTHISRERLFRDPTYLRSLLEAFQERQGEAGIERFPDAKLVDQSPGDIVAMSNLERSRTLWRGAFGGEEASTDARLGALKARVRDKNVAAVSFDVFDTLVCRTVLSPAHVFELMSRRLAETHNGILPRSLIDNFAGTRAGTERMIRARLDRATGGPDEMRIEDVYEEMLAAYGLSAELVSELVEIEQELELEVLVPRRDIVSLYKWTRNLGKPTTIISDFIHSGAFVARVLEKCGITEWDGFYVSSETGSKKHSGALFSTYLEERGLDAARCLHVGDNLHGDIAMAEAMGMIAMEIPALPKMAMDRAGILGIDRKLLNDSVRMGAVLSVYAHNNFGMGGSRNGAVAVEGDDGELIDTRFELGFLLLGPLMHFFAQSILQQARDSGCRQIVFFARDTVLPWRMAQALIQPGDPELVYWPVSRSAVAMLEIYQPEDLLNVRIDDFNRSGTLISLMEQRFHLKQWEIDRGAVMQWCSKPFEEVLVSDIHEFAILNIAVQSARSHWKDYYVRVEARRERFLRAARSWGTDFSAPTLTVDFGYRGTIHKKVESLFETPPSLHMFMSYADRSGHPPMRNCSVFYFAEANSRLGGAEPLIEHNLLFETLINEGVGSTLDYIDSEDGSVEVIRDSSVDHPHARAIAEIHSGAIRFSEYWNTRCGPIDRYTVAGRQDLAVFFRHFADTPSAAMALLLSPLIFDNPYAGHQPRRLLDTDAKDLRNGAVWKAGQEAIIASRTVKTVKTVKEDEPVLPPSELPRLRQLGLRFVRPLVLLRAGKNRQIVRNYDRDPVGVFRNSPHTSYRILGRILLGPYL